MPCTSAKAVEIVISLRSIGEICGSFPSSAAAGSGSAVCVFSALGALSAGFAFSSAGWAFSSVVFSAAASRAAFLSSFSVLPVGAFPAAGLPASAALGVSSAAGAETLLSAGAFSFLASPAVGVSVFVSCRGFSSPADISSDSSSEVSTVPFSASRFFFFFFFFFFFGVSSITAAFAFSSSSSSMPSRYLSIIGVDAVGSGICGTAGRS